MWRQQMEATIWGHGLESYITGDEPAPPMKVKVGEFW